MDIVTYYKTRRWDNFNYELYQDYLERKYQSEGEFIVEKEIKEIHTERRNDWLKKLKNLLNIFL